MITQGHPQTQGEIADDGRNPRAGGGANAGTANGCHPLEGTSNTALELTAKRTGEAPHLTQAELDYRNAMAFAYELKRIRDSPEYLQLAQRAGWRGFWKWRRGHSITRPRAEDMVTGRCGQFYGALEKDAALAKRQREVAGQD